MNCVVLFFFGFVYVIEGTTVLERGINSDKEVGQAVLLFRFFFGNQL